MAPFPRGTGAIFYNFLCQKGAKNRPFYDDRRKERSYEDSATQTSQSERPSWKKDEYVLRDSEHRIVSYTIPIRSPKGPG